MSFKDKKNDNIELDDIKIKSHLNTSLDLNKISISEDLINRTLEAIRMQPSTENSKSEDDLKFKDVQKKVIPWNRYARSIVGVAAAALVVLVGYNVMKSLPNVNIGFQKNATSDYQNDENSAMEESQADTELSILSENESTSAEAPEAGSAGTLGITASEYTITGNGAMQDGTEYKVETEESDLATEAEEERVNTDVTDSAKIGLSTAKDTGEPQILTFQNICVLTPEQLKSVTITNQEKGTTISLTDQIEILDFYSMMEKHTFTYTTEGSAIWYYGVDLISPLPEEALYTLLVGESVTVRYRNGEEINDNTYKSTNDQAFKLDLDKFFEEYNNN